MLVVLAVAPPLAVHGAPRIRRRTRVSDTGRKRFIVQVKNDKGRQDIGRVAATSRGSPSASREVLHDYYSVDLDEQGVEELIKDDNIISMEEDSLWEPLGFRDEPASNEAARHLLETQGWGIQEVQADQLQIGDSPVTVCVIDSGVAVNHPDLANADVSGVNRTSQDDGSEMPWNEDARGHGTHVAGILAARIENDIGVRGVGDIPLFISRALNDAGVAYQSDIMGAMQDCRAGGAKIISISLGGSYMVSAMRRLISELFDDGILIVSAAGNDGKFKASYPGTHRDVISVTALKQGQQLWENSNSGPWLELAAPGHQIRSTYPPDDYATFSGTSAATPFVAGVAALVWSHFPQCQHSQIRYALAKTAKDLGPGGCDKDFGFGLVQARAAYEFLEANPCETAEWGRVRVTGMCSTLIDPTEAPTLVRLA